MFRSSSFSILLAVIMAVALAPSAGAAVITQLSSFSEFQSTLVTIEDFDSSLSDRTEFSFDPNAGQFPTNTNQFARSGLSWLGEHPSTAPLEVTMNVEVFEVGFYAGNDDAILFGQVTFFLDAFDQDGNLLDTVSVTANNNDLIDQFVGLRSDMPIGSVGIRYTDTDQFFQPGIAIDDFGVGFEPASSGGPVPEPATLTLLSAGLGLMAISRRRVKRG